MAKRKKKRNQVNDSQRANNIILEPQTPKQAEYLTALKNHSQVFAVGPAGTGKTYMPTVFAAEKYLYGQIKRIVVTRPAVEVGESHGYLPGTIEKKIAPWVQPVTEILKDCMGKGRFQDMYKYGDFEVAPFAYMRGRTFNDCFVILDEAQNTTPKQMEMFLTRLGYNCHVVISGDLRQTDVLTPTSGLGMAVELMKHHVIPAKLIQFTSEDVVRSEMCRHWVEAFEKGLPL